MPQLPAPMTTAFRSGGSPPSHSHCSSMLGQIRDVTVAASAGEGWSVRGKVIARPIRSLTLRGRIRQPAADLLGPVDGDREHGGAGLERQPPDAAPRARQRSGAVAGPLGEDADGAAALEHAARRRHRVLVGLAAPDREGPEARQQPALPALLEQLDLGDVVHRPPPGQRDADHERVEEAAVVGGDDQRTADPGVLAADAREPEPEQKARLQHEPREPVHQQG